MQVLSITSTRGGLFIPLSIVAQVIRNSEGRDWDSELDFVESTVNWRDYSVPLVKSSELLGAGINADRNYNRAVVLWPMKSGGKTDLFALTSLDSPRVLTIDSSLESIKTAEDLELVNHNPYLLDAVEIDGIRGFIPNLDTISSHLFKTH